MMSKKNSLRPACRKCRCTVPTLTLTSYVVTAVAGAVSTSRVQNVDILLKILSTCIYTRAIEERLTGVQIKGLGQVQAVFCQETYEDNKAGCPLLRYMETTSGFRQ